MSVLSLKRLSLIPALALLMSTPLFAADEEKAPAPESVSEETQAQAEDAKGIFDWKLQDQLGDTAPWAFYGHIQQGFTYNPDDPRDRQNFGRIFDDRSNDYRLNQILLTGERVLTFEPGEFGWGAKAQFMYGSDARLTAFLGITDEMSNSSVTLDIVELFANFHFPVLTDGGVDLKLGHFVTLMGAEVIDAKGNPLYSHSYSFNFGIPLKHTGFLATVHATENIDLMAGLVSGINTGYDDNNSYHAFHGGIFSKWADGKLTNMTSFHAGQENPDDASDDMDCRYILSSVTTWQIAEGFKSITDLNYGEDQGGFSVGLGQEAIDAEWYGIAQYFIFDINDKLAFVVRGEIFRDDDNFAVAQFAENDDFMDFQNGTFNNIDSRTHTGGPTTYYALTLGLNIKPKDNLLIRPEVRWDWADDNDTMEGSAPFDDSSDNDQFTVGVDVVFSF